MKKYPLIAHEGTLFEREVFTLKENKELTYKSPRGLYLWEILLLEYVSYGKYPLIVGDYPQFWWYEYGLKDNEINDILDSLCKKGFIEEADFRTSLKTYTIKELKNILSHYNMPVTGKKDILIERICSSSTNVDEIKMRFNVTTKYKLTSLGEVELHENYYIPYLHKSHFKEVRKIGNFNVWTVNDKVKGGMGWKDVVISMERDRMYGMSILEDESKISEVMEMYTNLNKKLFAIEDSMTNEERLKFHNHKWTKEEIEKTYNRILTR